MMALVKEETGNATAMSFVIGVALGALLSLVVLLSLGYSKLRALEHRVQDHDEINDVRHNIRLWDVDELRNRVHELQRRLDLVEQRLH